MKRLTRVFPLTCLLMLVLAGCGGSSNTGGGPTEVKIAIGDFYVHSPQTTFTTGVRYHFVVTNEGGHHHDFLIILPFQHYSATL